MKGSNFLDAPTRSSWLFALASVGVFGIGVASDLPVYRTIAGFFLVGFLPGYCLSRLLYGLQITIRVFVFSSIASLFMAILIALPSMIAYGGMVRIPLAISYSLFCLGCLAIERVVRPEPPRSDAPKLDRWSLIVIAIFVFLQVTFLFVLGRYLEPSNPDWAYEVGMIAQLRQFPAVNPEAAWTLLKQPWGYWGLYSVLAMLAGLPIMTVLKISSVALATIMLTLVYLLCRTLFNSSRIGMWAIVFLATTSEIKWLLSSIMNRRFVLDRVAQGTVQTSGDNLLFAWYNTPALIGATAVVYFAIRFYQNGQKVDWIIALLLAAALPFFHPTFYGMTMGGLALFVIINRGWRKHLWNWLAFGVTVMPFVLCYKILYQTQYTPIPLSPMLSLDGLSANLLWYIKYCGLLIPLALVAIIFDRAKSIYFTPFAIVPAVLAVTTTNIAGNYHWYYDIHAVWLAILASVGLMQLARAKTRVYHFGYIALIGFTILAVTTLAGILPAIIQGSISRAVFKNRTMRLLAGSRTIRTPKIFS